MLDNYESGGVNIISSVYSAVEINRKTFCRNRKRGISGEDFLPKAEINRNKSVSAERASFCRKMLISAESGLFRSIFYAAVTSNFG